MAQSATTQAGLDALISSFAQTLLDDATAADICKTLGITGPDGWIDRTSNTFTYSSADAPTFVATTPSDLSGVIPLGARIKLTQTTVKYFIVTAIDASTITLYGGTDYVLANAAISNVSYSLIKAPVGFPLNPTKWTVEVSDTVNANKNTPVTATWYGDTGLSPTGPSIVIPIGCWRVYYEAIVQMTQTASDTAIETYITLSTASNTESDKEFTNLIITGDANAAGKVIGAGQYREKILNLAAKSTRYLNVMVDSGGNTITILGGIGNTVIRAVCAYL